MKVICPFCKETISIDEKTQTISCNNCNNIFPNLSLPYSQELFLNFINLYLSSLPRIFPYTVAFSVKDYFENDYKRIFHAFNVANYAKYIAQKEKADLEIVLSCGYLHDIGIKIAELKYNSSAPKYQEIEGPPVAKEILTTLNCKKELIEEICDIIGHHHSPRENESINFKCLYDADLIVNWIDGVKEREVKKENVKNILRLFYTDTGKYLLENISKNV